MEEETPRETPVAEEEQQLQQQQLQQRQSPASSTSAYSCRVRLSSDAVLEPAAFPASSSSGGADGNGDNGQRALSRISEHNSPSEKEQRDER